MDNLQKLAVTASRNFRLYFDSAYRHGNTCLSTIRNTCNSSINRAASNTNTIKFQTESDLLCSTGNTRQRNVELVNTTGVNLIQRRNVSTTNTNLSNIFNVQDEKDFKAKVLDSTKPVIVDFHAVWCGPCKILAPKLERLLSTFEGKAEFAKIDIDQHADLAFDYNVQSVPTVIAFKNGKAIAQFVGVIDDDKITKFITDAVEAK